jgi:GNAT superfamily N-acetyltransferase
MDYRDMNDQQVLHGDIRKLWPSEWPRFRDHLLRLDKASRRMRFAHGVSDAFIEDYAARMAEMGGIVYGYFDGTEVRAAAELKKLGDTWGREAEAAFSVEQPLQEHGIGTELMGRVIRAARNRGVHHLCISCLAENSKMRAIAAHFGADLRFEYGEIVGEIVPEGPNYFSLLAEAVEDRFGFMMAVLDLPNRVRKAA